MTEREFVERFSFDVATDLLGEGGFGSVYRAYDNFEHEYVALKMQDVNPQYRELRLRNEYEKVQQFTHPYIARYKACYTLKTFKGETDIAVMKYYEAGSLDKLIAKGALTFEQRCTMLEHILEGIGFLHGNGIIHRDLKPQNILIVEHAGKYAPLITDFGISKQLEEGQSSAVSNSVLGGTRNYASPEQLKESTIRKNTDLWSFGIIAYQMFTGTLPFNSGQYSPTSEDGRSEYLRQVKSGILPDALNGIPEPWQTLVRACLVVDSEKRIAHAEDGLDIIRGVVVEEPMEVTVIEESAETVIDIPKQPIEKPAEVVVEEKPAEVEKVVAEKSAEVEKVAAEKSAVVEKVAAEKPAIEKKPVVEEIVEKKPEVEKRSIAQKIDKRGEVKVVEKKQPKPNRPSAKVKRYLGTAIGGVLVITCIVVVYMFISGKMSTNGSAGKEVETVVNTTHYVEKANGLSMKMIWVEGGKFRMGSTVNKDEEPTHNVTLDGFWMAETEVTRSQWKAVMGEGGESNSPIRLVSYDEALEFCEKLSNLTGKHYTLPTEAQWEYAARGGNKSQNYNYSGSNQITDVAWYSVNSGSEAHAVKSLKPNELGLYDMSGNVWEWCLDYYGEYRASDATNPQGPRSGKERVLRGGGYDRGATYNRVTNRNCDLPTNKRSNNGLRVVCIPD